MSYLRFVGPFIKYFVLFIIYFLNQGSDLGFMSFVPNFSNKLKWESINIVFSLFF